MRHTQISGHGLIGEGSPHDDNGQRSNLGGIAGWGRGLCTCGAISEHVHSARKRRAWHDQHKAEVAPIPATGGVMTTPEHDIRAGQTWEAIDSPGCNYRALITVTDPDDAGWIVGIYKQQCRSTSGWWRDCIGPGAPRRTRIKPGSLRQRYRLLFDADFDGDRDLIRGRHD